MRKKLMTIGLCALAFLVAQDAHAVPGLNSSSSVKEITKLLKAYAGSNAVNIYQLEQQLRDKPSEAAQALIDMLDTGDEQLKIHCAQLLQRLASHNDFTLSDSDIKTLAGMLQAADNSKIQVSLLATLGSVGPKNDLVKTTIVNSLKNSPEPNIRKAAAEALAKLAKEERPAMHAVSTTVLLETLKSDQSPLVRATAAGALGSYRDNPTVVVPALVAAMDDNYLQVRSRAAQALSYYQAAAAPAIPKLIEALKTESDQSMRHSCINALRSINPRSPEVLEAFASLVDEPQIGDIVLNYMLDAGPGAAKIIPKLIERLNGTNIHHRMMAARSLGSMGTAAKDAIPALQTASQSTDSRLRRAAEEALRQIRPDTTTGGTQFSSSNE